MEVNRMQKKIMVHTAHLENAKLMLTTNENVKELVPTGQMLADSDYFSFIYLMEKEDDYIFLVLPEPIWPMLNDGLSQNSSVILTCNDEQIELLNFYEELQNLISNIKGNGNYGNEMVEKVETIFHF
jgi:hypothetical protein